ncbi:Hypothetical_protein [Hexamita inflata]|uniref:Hypothetical_protein n=1 Tax=Hexamita inflata TaxID=28002 RepID=A0ABP1HWT5_9EUKA
MEPTMSAKLCLQTLIALWIWLFTVQDQGNQLVLNQIIIALIWTLLLVSSHRLSAFITRANCFGVQATTLSDYSDIALFCSCLELTVLGQIFQKYAAQREPNRRTTSLFSYIKNIQHLLQVQMHKMVKSKVQQHEKCQSIKVLCLESARKNILLLGFEHKTKNKRNTYTRLLYCYIYLTSSRRHKQTSLRLSKAKHRLSHARAVIFTGPYRKYLFLYTGRLQRNITGK